MTEIVFALASDKLTIEAHITTKKNTPVTSDAVLAAFNQSEFNDCHIEEEFLASAQKILTNLKLDGSKLPPIPLGLKKDAAITLDIDIDNMQASIAIAPPEGGRQATEETILLFLRKHKITEGIHRDLIPKIVDQCSRIQRGKSVTSKIAKGKKPGKAHPTEFKPLATAIQDRKLCPTQNEDGSVDMYALGAIEIVSPGEELMLRVPATTGESGFDIYGNAIFATPHEDIPFDIGEGADVSPTNENLLVATGTGVPVRTPHGMRVSEALVFDQIDLASGSINFEGTVMVRGNVSPGLSVSATKDIVIGGCAENCTLTAGKSITISQGVLGVAPDSEDNIYDNLTTELTAGESIDVGYAQYAKLHSHGSILTTNHLLHCNTSADDTVTVGHGNPQGRLVGGICTAGNAIIASEIGASAGVKTIIDSASIDASLRELLVILNQQQEDKELLNEGQDQTLEWIKTTKPTPELMRLRRKTMLFKEQNVHAMKTLAARIEALSNKLSEEDRLMLITAQRTLFANVEFRHFKGVYDNLDDRKKCVIQCSKDSFKILQ
ncbi:hypothetical protein A9Q99_08945 [Gammaproteobacteria bacterium 45_16_T64]|nr:hypothetical protein A9Q99_08945 [Gammaproteobacteria bacterium 45_16_T64]